MRDLSDIITLHKNQLRAEAPFVWLYEVDTNEDPLTTIRLTNYDKQVTAPHPLSLIGEEFTWYPAPIVHGGVEQSGEGDLPSITVTVGNASLEVGTIIERLAGMAGNQARIWLISSLDMSNLSTGIFLEGEINSCSVNATSATFQFASFNPFQRSFPPYLFSRRQCRWLYGDVNCGAKPGEGSVPLQCPGYTLSACEEVGDAEAASNLPRLHPQQFGGFPGIPPQR